MTNEKFFGDTVTQKTVTIDFLSHKRVLNKDHKPKYYIQNTHPGIISKEDWDAVQKELTRRGEMLRDPDNKYRMNYSSIAPFSNKLFCGACDRPAIRRRLTSKNKGEKYKFTAWQCRVAAHKHCDDLVCNRKYIWEEVLENEFMKLLHKMNNDKDRIIQEVENMCTLYELSNVEKEKLKELEVKLDNVSERITLLASRESMINDPIYDATLRHMIYEQEILQLEHENLSKMDSESKFLRKQLSELLECLDTLKPEDGFRADILGKAVEKGVLHEDYRVEFYFKCGIKRDIFGYSGRYL